MNPLKEISRTVRIGSQIYVTNYKSKYFGLVEKMNVSTIEPKPLNEVTPYLDSISPVYWFGVKYGYKRAGDY